MKIIIVLTNLMYEINKLCQGFFGKIKNYFFQSATCVKITPESVNYHFTRQCNYNCGFCFHTSKTSYILPLARGKRGLCLLKQSGLKKLNFSGGEPFLEPRFMGLLAKYCKMELNLESVSIVSNGSKITKNWMETYGKYVDILAISCDSFDYETNHKIGRYHNSRTKHVEKLTQIKNWCDDYGVGFKINTVVNTENIDEDFTANIECLKPIRWKVFQCLLLEGENAGADALRNAERFYITDQQFDDFVRRHSHVDCMVPESNEKMKDSYLILDEYMRFLNCRDGKKIPSHSILDVGVAAAMNHSGFDEDMFKKRGGKYDWKKESFEW